MDHYKHSFWRRSEPHSSISTTETYFDNMIKSKRNGELAFVLILPQSASTAPSTPTSFPTTTDEGKVIGHAGLWEEHKNELVFMISNKYWKQGYMTEVLAALVPMFWEKGIRKVYAYVDTSNEASLQLLRKLGFSKDGLDLVESYKPAEEVVRMELRNPDGGGEEKGSSDDGSNV